MLWLYANITSYDVLLVCMGIPGIRSLFVLCSVRSFAGCNVSLISTEELPMPTIDSSIYKTMTFDSFELLRQHFRFGAFHVIKPTTSGEHEERKGLSTFENYSQESTCFPGNQQFDLF